MNPYILDELSEITQAVMAEVGYRRSQIYRPYSCAMSQGCTCLSNKLCLLSHIRNKCNDVCMCPVLSLAYNSVQFSSVQSLSCVRCSLNLPCPPCFPCPLLAPLPLSFLPAMCTPRGFSKGANRLCLRKAGGISLSRCLTLPAVPLHRGQPASSSAHQQAWAQCPWS